MARQERIATSITRAIILDLSFPSTPRSLLARFLAFIRALFTFYQLLLLRHRNDLFSSLRTKTWNLTDEDYNSSFTGSPETPALKSTSTMGFSGSTFFVTRDDKYLVKSVPRRFEHSFFRDDFLDPYVAHMKRYPESLLIRITDFLAEGRTSLGGLLGLAPTHHIVMANLLVGKDEAEEGSAKWETYDLKPTSYFFPERDIAGGRLTSEATKERLADRFEDKIVLSKEDAQQLMEQLEKDTKVLEDANAVDYSLFLVRIPLKKVSEQEAYRDEVDVDEEVRVQPPPPPTDPPFAPPSPPSWRTGIRSADGDYVYRLTVLDFFWAKHKIHARFMTALIAAWNLVDRQGPMSITTTSDEYRERFLKMVHGMVEAQERRDDFEVSM